MPVKKESRHCHNCDKPLSGRADKKFCNDLCRNEFNNHLKQDDNNYVRNINNSLKKNRRILEALLTEDAANKTIEKKLLDEQGFQFKYHTHTYTNKKGAIYFFCYDYGYLPLGADRFLLVRRKSEG